MIDFVSFNSRTVLFVRSDWYFQYNIQFYNQNDYETCDSLITESSSQWADSAVMQMVAQKFPANKLVIGKPATTGDASNGYVDPTTLANCTLIARKQGWNAGVMSWQVSAPVSLHFALLI